VPWQHDDGWVLKPALGRVGEDVGIAGVTAAPDWKRIARGVRRHAGHWIAQRRFAPTPLLVADQTCYPGIGVYTRIVMGDVPVPQYLWLALMPIVRSPFHSSAL